MSRSRSRTIRGGPSKTVPAVIFCPSLVSVAMLRTLLYPVVSGCRSIRTSDAALGRDQSRVDEVHRPGHHGTEEPGQDGPRQQLGIALADGARQRELDPAQALGVELQAEAPEPLGERHERP